MSIHNDDYILYDEYTNLKYLLHNRSANMLMNQIFTVEKI